MLEYKMKVDFDAERWFQVEITSDQQIEFKFSENPLTVSLAERGKILIAVTTAVEALLRYQGANGG